MNRCLVAVLVVLLVSSGVNEVHDALDYFVEETSAWSFSECLQSASITQVSIWDGFTRWWGSEEVGAIRRRKKPVANKAILKPQIKA